MELIIDGEKIPGKSLVELMKNAANIILYNEGIKNPEIEISVTFVDTEEIRELNRNFRNIDKVTDVLSFPQFQFPADIPQEGVVLLGDVVICMEMIEKQAKEFSHSEERETLYLFTHSMLHLLGYDHIKEDDKALMRKAEEKVMNELGIHG